MSTEKPTTLCPCGSTIEFKSCCEPFLKKKQKATTAEQLLRARYVAFTRGEVDFILDTHHSKTRAEINRKEVEEWAAGSEWLGLQIAQKEAGTEKDDKGTIIFCATYKPKTGDSPKAQEHWEQSFFEKENGEWKFLDAKGVHLGTYRREGPKVGRNDPCPCGSGKKLKKCCAA